MTFAVCPHPSCTTSPVIPWSNHTALSSLVYPSAPVVEEQERWVGSSEADDVEDERTTLNSSFTTSMLSTLHLNHPSMLPSDHLTNTTEAVQDVLELCLAGRCIHDGPVCLMLSPVLPLSCKEMRTTILIAVCSRNPTCHLSRNSVCFILLFFTFLSCR